MSACWYVRIMGEVLGPYGNDTLREMVRANRITPSDELRREDGPWVPANEVWELFTNDASNDPLDRIALEAVSDGRAGADARPSTRTDEPTRCPYCRETIHHGARKCRHCGETLDLKLRRLHNSSQGQAEPKQKAVVLALLNLSAGSSDCIDSTSETSPRAS